MKKAILSIVAAGILFPASAAKKGNVVRRRGGRRGQDNEKKMNTSS